MSVIRQIKINYDLDRLKKVCQELGLYVKEDVHLRDILGHSTENDLVLAFAVAKNANQTKFNLGFFQEEDKTFMYIDKYYPENDELMQEIVTRYITDSLYPFYSISEVKALTKKEIVLVFTK